MRVQQQLQHKAALKTGAYSTLAQLCKCAWNVVLSLGHPICTVGLCSRIRTYEYIFMKNVYDLAEL